MVEEEETSLVEPEDYFDPSVGTEGPEFSLGKFFSSVLKRGIKETLTDGGMEPHAHLISLLLIVLVIAIVGGVLFIL
ncbi:MAG: hypothetical protein QGH39_11715 [Candidatus Thermoplasmatota archaeon]|jgi:hypothetical protein|nr:hypothetical protein [Candidatus Thermoplasmatota archaeon]MDP7266212.1 hypothetical protein [Candidatus Thermoplasmatota archaeon]